MIMSVHPILQSAPRATSSHLKNGRKIPFVTVVTDLGEAHPWWFNKKLDALFVPTRAMKEQGIQLGLKADNIHVCGLPLVRFVSTRSFEFPRANPCPSP
jgi:1,2-diacylglycerol 3-beta-galactosyltransferase